MRRVRNRRSKLRSLSEYALARGACSLIGSLPPQIAETLASRLLPALASGLLTRHRRRAFRNLELAFGSGDHKPTLRKMYGHLCKMFLDLLIRSRWADGGYSIEVAPESRSIGKELKHSESPYIFVSGHLGHWEILGGDASRLGFPCHCVARRLDNPYLEAWITERRSAAGNVIVHVHSTDFLDLASRLQKGHHLAFLVDQNQSRGIFVDFFGVPAATNHMPALLALETGCSIVPICCVEGPTPRTRQIHLAPPLVPDRTRSSDEEVQRLTATYTLQIEEWVRRWDDQYLWIHRRWKSRPPGEKNSRFKQKGI